MRKLSRKARLRDVQRALLHRKKGIGKNRLRKRKRKIIEISSWAENNAWLEGRIKTGLQAVIRSNNTVVLTLPKSMNFSDKYEDTAIYFEAIRKLVRTRPIPKTAYRLGSVNFGKLEDISTSAALVLTAELARWEDYSSRKLSPTVGNWDSKIYRNFTELGFFDLFENTPERSTTGADDNSLNLVKYIKAQDNVPELKLQLKREIARVVGDDVDKWGILRAGIDEAILNVINHAYPDSVKIRAKHKNWYMTGSFDKKERHLKIAFYDQGIGIPASLPATKIGERVLAGLKMMTNDSKLYDATLISAAAEMSRTRTGEEDRGKGFPDMKEFIAERGQGYLAIMSKRGLYKFWMEKGKKMSKKEGFKNPIDGTLIIWQVKLAEVTSE